MLAGKFDVSARNAIRTPQFWLLWVVLCFNVTAGIGILERAAPIWTDFFGGGAAAAAVTAAAAGYVALLSLANMTGRIGWSTTSDFVGRKNMYRVYLGVGALLYLTITAHHQQQQGAVPDLLDAHPLLLRRGLRHRARLPA